MATSGSINFNSTRNEIIRQAALDLKAISAGVAMGNTMLTDFAFRLNAMVKRWNAMGIHVWTVAEATLFPQVSQVKYNLGGAGTTDHATLSYTSTALAADAANGASTITVDSITGISNGDNVGVVVDDGTLHWTTVNGAPSGTTVTLTAALDDSATTDNKVYAYTTKIGRPLKVPDARRYNVANSRDTPMKEMSHLDYQRLPNKTSTGTITQFYYDPQLTAGYLYLWYAPLAVDELVNFTFYRPMEDFDAAGDNPDLPQEWISTLIANLAYEMRNQFPTSPARAQELRASATQTLLDVIGFDREPESIQFQPDFD